MNDHFLIQPLDFKLFMEMAVIGDVGKLPISIEKDDLNYLKQFPFQYWEVAMSKRFELLFESIKKMQEIRKSMGANNLEERIKEAILTDNWEEVRDWKPSFRTKSFEGLRPFTNGEIEKFENEYKTLNEKQKQEIAEDAAHKITYTHFQQFDQGLPNKDDETVDAQFILREGTRAETERKTFRFRPHLARLYERLEKTAGQNHSELFADILGPVAKYGFDLSKPTTKKGSRTKDLSTSGMTFPKLDVIKKIMKDFLTGVEKRLFVPEDIDLKDPNVEWKETNKASSYYKDFLDEELKNRYNNSPYVEGESRGGRITRLTKEIQADVDSGKLKVEGPPIPGHPIHGEGRAFETGKEKIFLPFSKEKTPVVTIDENGNEKIEYVQQPLVGPSFPYRLKKEKDQSNLVGYNDQYVKISPQEYTTSHLAKGSFSVAKLKSGRKFLSPHEEEYQNNLKAILPGYATEYKDKNDYIGDPNDIASYDGPGVLVIQKDDENNYVSSFYPLIKYNRSKDTEEDKVFGQFAILQGMSGCFNSGKFPCSDFPTYLREKTIDQNKIQKWYDEIEKRFLRTLNDKKLLKKANRVEKAKFEMGSLMQQFVDKKASPEEQEADKPLTRYRRPLNISKEKLLANLEQYVSSISKSKKPTSNPDQEFQTLLYGWEQIFNKAVGDAASNENQQKITNTFNKWSDKGLEQFDVDLFFDDLLELDGELKLNLEIFNQPDVDKNFGIAIQRLKDEKIPKSTVSARKPSLRAYFDSIKGMSINELQQLKRTEGLDEKKMQLVNDMIYIKSIETKDIAQESAEEIRKILATVVETQERNRSNPFLFNLIDTNVAPKISRKIVSIFNITQNKDRMKEVYDQLVTLDNPELKSFLNNAKRRFGF